jgi:hypothetical protein
MSLGEIIPSVRNGPIVDTLVPTPREGAKPKSLSALYGLGAFPFHTDSANQRTPPRYLLLRLADGCPSTRPTLLMDTSAMEFSVADAKVLERDVWYINGGRGRFLCSIRSKDLLPGRVVYRYDMRAMKPAHRTFGASSELLQRSIQRTAVTRVDWAPEKALAIDNWRVLHARGETNEEAETRTLQRILVSA